MGGCRVACSGAVRAIGSGIVSDVKGRLPWYRRDWVQGLNCGIRILAPAVYIFFASVIPALAFGEQLANETDGTLTAVQVLIATTFSGLVQSLFGGQPLLIVGVSEPIVLMYKYMYTFAEDKPDLGGADGLFLAWAAWVCVWAGCFCMLLALSNSCAAINRFTRMSGELFGLLISLLFMQQAIKGIVHEFQQQEQIPGVTNSSPESQESRWTLANGLWSIILASGLLLTSLVLAHARRWVFFRPWARGLLADYGAPLMVLVWSLVGYIIRLSAPQGVPRTVSMPNTWSDTATRTWTVARDMHLVPAKWVAAGAVPGLLIALLFWFDHNVSSQMSQRPEFGLEAPPAYHYDLMLLSLMTVVCGIIGVPPINGVLPQAPLHSRKLAVLQMVMDDKERRRREKEEKHTVAAVESSVQQQKGCSWLGGKLRLRRKAVTSATNGTDIPAVEARNEASAVCRSHDDTPLSNGATATAAAARTLEMPPLCGAIGPAAAAIPSSNSNGGSLVMSCSSDKPALGQAAPHASPERVLKPSCTDQHNGDCSDSGQAAARLQLQPASVEEVEGQQESAGQQQGQQQQERGERVPVSCTACAGTGYGPDEHDVMLAGERPPSEQGQAVIFKVREQRATNLLQALLVGLCLFATPALRLIPSAVLWGFFAFMAVEGLEGSQMWERLLLMFTDPAHRRHMLEVEHPAYLETVPFRVVVGFTVLQTAYLGGVYALTWAGVAGILFPVPILALIPVRQHLLPRLFRAHHLADLDAAEYEEAEGVEPATAAAEAAAQGLAPLPPAAMGGGGGMDGGGSSAEVTEDVIDREVVVGWRQAQIRTHLSHEAVLHRISHDNSGRASTDTANGTGHSAATGRRHSADLRRVLDAEEGHGGPVAR